MSILYSVITLAGLCLVFGILITFASKKFEVKKDDRVEKILELLPNGNCGGCGYAGCSAYAQAVVDGVAVPDLCSAGGAVVANEIGKIMGVTVKEKETVTAHVLCCGNSENVSEKYIYDGVKNCISAS
ncbi:MAG: RnfABCDGE type electron transport complex subunit B, partial [Clostridia bacterium]|nr:RnfABCDGE type electron transport complex subunit B [Clostridia bacterium]